VVRNGNSNSNEISKENNQMSQNTIITVSTSNLTPGAALKKNEALSRNGHLKSDFLRAANNTKNNLSYMTRTKLTNSSNVNHNNSLQGCAGVVINTHSKGNCMTKTPSTHNKHTSIHSLHNLNPPQLPFSFNMNFSNNHSRNHNKNEISTLSDLTSSINRDRAASKDSSIRKTTNVILKPKINISFVNNINNMMTSIDSLSNPLGPKENMNNNYHNILQSAFPGAARLNNQGNQGNKKSRNEKVDSFLSKSSNSNNASKDKKLPNYRTMMTGVYRDYKDYKDYRDNRIKEVRNVKTHYSVNIDSFSKERERDHSTGTYNNPNKSLITGNTSIMYQEKKHSRNSTSVSNHMILPEYSFNNSSIKISKSNTKYGQVKVKPTMNTTFSKEPQNQFGNVNLSSSNYLYLKQRISNMKLGVGKLKPTPATNGKSFILYFLFKF
jgi:hypothetical protein